MKLNSTFPMHYVGELAAFCDYFLAKMHFRVMGNVLSWAVHFPIENVAGAAGKRTGEFGKCTNSNSCLFWFRTSWITQSALDPFCMRKGVNSLGKNRCFCDLFWTFVRKSIRNAVSHRRFFTPASGMRLELHLPMFLRWKYWFLWFPMISPGSFHRAEPLFPCAIPVPRVWK